MASEGKVLRPNRIDEAPEMRAQSTRPAKVALSTLEQRYRWRRVNFSFSGGRTSAFMSRTAAEALIETVFGMPRRNVAFTFANTGQEHPETLDFVQRCDEAYGLGVVWVEAVVHPDEERACTHRVVTYETASRNGEPFERVIEKYGLPGPGFLHCTRELKANPIRSYLRSIGWATGSYDTAIGIRADEMDRIAPDADERGLKYPLVTLGIKKADVLAAFAGSNTDLTLPEHLGNCTWCWKKSERKHLTLMRDHPEVFDFPRRMEALHADTGSGDQRRFLFRKRRTVADFERMAKEPFEPFVDAHLHADPDLDVGSDCDETCEIEAA